MPMAKQTIGLVLAAALGFAPFTALAQSATPQEIQKNLVQQITEAADSIAGELAASGERLAKLPEDLKAAEAEYDALLASGQRVLALLADDEEIGANIGNLRSSAIERRDRWREQCASTGAKRDCEREQTWESSIGQAIELEQQFDRARRNAERAIEDVRQDRIYIIDDIELSKWNAARDSLGGALDRVEEMVVMLRNLGAAASPGPVE